MKPLPGREGGATTRSFHRPIGAYINGLTDHGMLTERIEEIPAHKLVANAPSGRAVSLARKEIPLFLALRARKITNE
jgi:hypothetical protein